MLEGGSPLLGIFVGGESRRMGGIPKGLLPATPGDPEPIAARLARIARAADLEVVLVGDGAAYDVLGLPRIGDGAAYDVLGLPRIGDGPAYGVLGLPRIGDGRTRAGPLGGLVALLAAACGRDVIALACDMPRLAPSILVRLAEAPPGTTLAPRVDGVWQPLCARFASSCAEEALRRLVGGDRSMRGVLDAVGAAELSLSADEVATLVDWDTPEDVQS